MEQVGIMRRIKLNIIAAATQLIEIAGASRREDVNHFIYSFNGPYPLKDDQASKKAGKCSSSRR